MTPGTVEAPGYRLIVSIRPVHKGATRHHHYWVRIEAADVVRIASGGAPTYRQAWDAILAAVEASMREAA